MKNLSIILACILAVMVSCTKSKEVHPEIGDGNDEIVTVGLTDVHVEYARTDHAELSRTVFHYCPADVNGNAQQFESVNMIKKGSFFELTLNDLLSDTLYWYYYELFPDGGTATNTTYKTFRTQAYDAPEPPTPPTPPSGAPEGAINGLFTVNENGDQVYFSQGNLQYQASTNTWRFAENQWNYVGTQTPDWSSGMSGGNVIGSDNNNISESYDGWIDLFGWGTSGYNHGAVCYQPWSVSGSVEDYCPYGSNTASLYDGSGQADWGYNPILNGGNQEGFWRTMRIQEWDYVLNSRITKSGIRFVKAIVNNEGGLLLLPDEWNDSLFVFNSVNQSNASFSSNVISNHVWINTIQSNGAVFLPMAGDRIINLETGECNVTAYVGRYGLYWTANLSTIGGFRALLLLFSDDSVDLDSRPTETFFGFSVRLIQDAN